mmetsp:Transcript_8944/g.19730  ORF Transcript_8944/g.19730 Transcript_8944/m.19730 type:complete len:287 (+) Transcript_8944:198-1058(+)
MSGRGVCWALPGSPDARQGQFRSCCPCRGYACASRPTSSCKIGAMRPPGPGCRCARPGWGLGRGGAAEAVEASPHRRVLRGWLGHAPQRGLACARFHGRRRSPDVHRWPPPSRPGSSGSTLSAAGALCCGQCFALHPLQGRAAQRCQALQCALDEESAAGQISRLWHIQAPRSDRPRPDHPRHASLHVSGDSVWPCLRPGLRRLGPRGCDVRAGSSAAAVRCRQPAGPGAADRRKGHRRLAATYCGRPRPSHQRPPSQGPSRKAASGRRLGLVGRGIGSQPGRGRV